MNDTPTLGFAHFLAQGDFVSKALLVILLGMSVVSWTLILVKGITHFIRSSRAERFLKMFWEAPSMQAVAKDIAAHGVNDPFSRVAPSSDESKSRTEQTGTTRSESPTEENA